MLPSQAVEIEQLSDTLGATDADLLWLARLSSNRCSDVELMDMHLGELTRAEAAEMIETLRCYERYQNQLRCRN